MKSYVIIVAGGSGARMGTAVPKQFLQLAGQPVLSHSIKAFADAMPEAGIILVLPPHQLSYAQMILQAFPDRIDITLTGGGATRFESVRNGLSQLPEDLAENDIVLIHDGVRALVSPQLILRCLAFATEKGSAIPVIPITDSIRALTPEGSEAADRSALRIVQTPQAFHAAMLRRAFSQPYSDSFTDEATVLEAAGGTVFLVDGDKRNIKITTPEDLLIAEALLRQPSE